MEAGMNRDRRVTPAAWATLFIWILAACVNPAINPEIPPPPTSVLATTTPPWPAASSLPADKAATGESLRLIFDDDGSRDGLAALLYLLEHPGVSIQAV